MAMAHSHLSALLAGTYPSPASSFSGSSRKIASGNFFIVKTDICHHDNQLLQQQHQRQCRHTRVFCSSGDCAVVETAGSSKDAKSVSNFIRFYENGEEGFHLQTATITYRKPFPFSLLQNNLRVWILTEINLAKQCSWSRRRKKRNGWRT